MPCLIQRATGAYASLIARLMPVTAEMCRAHKIEYRHEVSVSPSKRARWERWEDLARWLDEAREGDVATLLDVDAVWVWPYVCISSALGDEDDIGAVKACVGDMHCGALYVRANERTRRLVADVLKGERTGRSGLLMPSAFGPGHLDSDYLNQLLGERDDVRVKVLGREWNNWPNAWGATPKRTFVRAWHSKGMQCKLDEAAKIAAALAGLVAMYARGVPACEFNDLVL